MNIEFTPYQNEEQSVTIEDVTIENRLDRVTIYGNIDVTKDQKGLAAARQLKMILDSVVKALEGTKNLPEQIKTEALGKMKNPF